MTGPANTAHAAKMMGSSRLWRTCRARAGGLVRATGRPADGRSRGPYPVRSHHDAGSRSVDPRARATSSASLRPRCGGSREREGGARGRGASPRRR
jgi:hypothetical protein